MHVNRAVFSAKRDPSRHRTIGNHVEPKNVRESESLIT